MISRLLVSLSTRSLRWWLLGFFVAITLPTILLIRYAYNQLQWEAFHQQRLAAETLVQQIDAALAGDLQRIAAYSFDDYQYLINVKSSGKALAQRSALAAFPVVGDLPGTLGHFQIDPNGEFSTPLLPDSESDGILDIEEPERYLRRENAAQLQSILSVNQLVVTPPQPKRTDIGNVLAAQEKEDTDDARYSQRAFDALSSKASKAETGRARDQAASPSVALEVSGRRRADLLEAVAEVPAAANAIANDKDILAVSFRADTEPLQLARLESGHLVLFRNVWRGGERYLQGLLIEQSALLERRIIAPFRSSALSQTSALRIEIDGERIFEQPSAGAGYSTTNELEDSLLLEMRLSSPLDRIRLVFNIQHLPLAAGARALAWITLIIAIVFLAAFAALYHLLKTQLELLAQQRDFISSVSHELKTPITSIRMYGEMLREGWADDAKKDTYYRYIHDESERLSRLIDNVLHLSRLNEKNAQLECEYVELANLIDQLTPKLTARLTNTGFTLRSVIDESIKTSQVWVDVDGFTQIMLNLFDNAIKFSADSKTKEIQLSAHQRSDGKLEISVRDYGPGIAAEQMRKIFQMFYRVENEMTRETIGTGIGLAIVHQLMKAMGGDIDVVNAQPGAHFRLRFKQLLSKN